MTATGGSRQTPAATQAPTSTNLTPAKYSSNDAISEKEIMIFVLSKCSTTLTLQENDSTVQ
jgi:hypothetical protein